MVRRFFRRTDEGGGKVTIEEPEVLQQRVRDLLFEFDGRHTSPERIMDILDEIIEIEKQLEMIGVKKHFIGEGLTRVEALIQKGQSQANSLGGESPVKKLFD